MLVNLSAIMLSFVILTCSNETESQGGVEEGRLNLTRYNQPGEAQVHPRLNVKILNYHFSKVLYPYNLTTLLPNISVVFMLNQTVLGLVKTTFHCINIGQQCSCERSERRLYITA